MTMKKRYEISDAPWRDRSERYGAWKTVYDRFNKWAKQGIFEHLFAELSIDADMQDMSIDRHQCQSTSARRRCKKGAVGGETNQDIGVSHGGNVSDCSEATA